MIDSIRFNTHITIDNLKPHIWKKYDKGKKEEQYYYIFINGIRIAFYPKSNSLIIGGRIINFYCNDKISNFDDLFASKEDLILFFNSVNTQLNSYLQNKKINLLKLKVTRIDFCFNVFTPNVNEYVHFLNKCYQYDLVETFNKYENYTTNNDLDLGSSFYLKTRADYIRKTNRNYVLNFYNKQKQLMYKRKKELEKFNRSSINDEIIDKSENIFRLEIQANYNLLRKICKDNNIKYSRRTLYDLFDINIAKSVFIYEFSRFFTTCDFYSYKKTKEILLLNGFGRKDKIFEYINDIAHYRKPSTYKKYENILKNLNIYPYMFLPSKWEIDKLENPIKLVENKINVNNLNVLYLKEREETLHDKI